MATAAAPTYQELFDLGRAEAALQRPDLTFDEGDISEMLVAGEAAMADHVAAYAANRFKATTVDGAAGEDLEAYADDRWQLAKEAAGFARGAVRLRRTNANGAPAGTLDAGALVATARDAQGVDVRFALDVAQAYGLGDITDRLVDVTATVAGPTGNVAVGAVSRFVESPFDSSFMVTNLAIFAGGNLVEADPALRERVRRYPSSLRKATLAAIEQGALEVEGVSVAIAVEELVGGIATGIVNLYVSDDEGNSTLQMIADVVTAMPAWKAGGAILNVVGGVVEAPAIALTIKLKAPLPVAAAAALVSLVQLAIVAEVNRLRAGEGFYDLTLAAAAKNANPLVIANARVTLPVVAENVAYTPANAWRTFRIATTDVTITVE